MTDRVEITDDLASVVLAFGRVLQTSSGEMTDEQHFENFQAKIAAGRAMHLADTVRESGKTKAHGVNLASVPLIQLALVGNSPNSEPVSKALTIAWNRLVDDCEGWLQQEDQKESMRLEAAE